MRIHGQWWIPARPELKVAGTLRWEETERRLHLDLIGSFDTVVPEASRQPPPSYAVVLGTTRDGDVLLEDCKVWSWSSRGLPPDIVAEEQTLWVGAAFVGGSCHSQNPPRLRYVEARCPLLADWVAAPPFSQRQGVVPTPSKPGLVERWELHIPPDVHVHVKHAVIGIRYSERWKEGTDFFHARRPIALTVRPTTPLTLDQLLDQLLIPVQWLLSLLTNAEFHFGELEARSNDDTDEYSRPTTVYYAGQKQGSTPSTSWQMPCTLAGLGDRWPDILRAWLELTVSSRSALDLFFVSQSDYVPLLDTRFLLIAQALEVFHRQVLNPSTAASAEGRQRFEAILSSAPEHHRDWLRGQLAFSHEPTFVSRVGEVLDHSGLRGSPALQDDFVSKVRDTRNYLTHFDSRSGKKAAHGSELYWLREQAVLVMQAALLRSAGFSVEESLKSLERTPRASAVVDRLSGAHGSPSP